jgi:hypothetical protein
MDLAPNPLLNHNNPAAGETVCDNAAALAAEVHEEIGSKPPAHSARSEGNNSHAYREAHSLRGVLHVRHCAVPPKRKHLHTDSGRTHKLQLVAAAQDNILTQTAQPHCALLRHLQLLAAARSTHTSAGMRVQPHMTSHRQVPHRTPQGTATTAAAAHVLRLAWPSRWLSSLLSSTQCVKPGTDRPSCSARCRCTR